MVQLFNLLYRLVLRSLEGLLAVLEEEEGWGFSCPRRDEVRKGEEEAGEEVEEEVSCTLSVWEERVDVLRGQPPWQETPIQYSSPEATVERKSQKKEKAFPTKRLFREKSEDEKKKLRQKGSQIQGIKSEAAFSGCANCL